MKTATIPFTICPHNAQSLSNFSTVFKGFSTCGEGESGTDRVWLQSIIAHYSEQPLTPLHAEQGPGGILWQRDTGRSERNGEAQVPASPGYFPIRRNRSELIHPKIPDALRSGNTPSATDFTSSTE
jgi:hypothetical protein